MGDSLKCSACLQILDTSFFYLDVSIKRGYSYKCKRCKKDKKLSSKPVVFLEDKKYCSRCENYKSLNEFSLCKNCPRDIRTYCASCESLIYKENKTTINKKQKAYVLKNREAILENKRIYYKKSKKKRNAYIKNKLLTDPVFKLKNSITKNINCKLRRNLRGSKEIKTLDILGCSIEKFKGYIEGKFEQWMSWDNYGKYNGDFNYGWDLDHIKPISSSKNDTEIYELNHYTNFQPLCSKVNRDIKWKNY